MELATRLFHGPIGAEMTLNMHPFALAATVGLLVTSLNLMPIGQLDGGHVLYALLGRHQRRLAWPIWLAVTALGLLWTGWWLMSALVLATGVRHPPVPRESTPLGKTRRRWACVALLLWLICFSATPIRMVPVRSSQDLMATMETGAPASTAVRAVVPDRGTGRASAPRSRETAVGR